MKVRELIDFLSKCDPEMYVYFRNYHEGDIVWDSIEQAEARLEYDKWHHDRPFV